MEGFENDGMPHAYGTLMVWRALAPVGVRLMLALGTRLLTRSSKHSAVFQSYRLSAFHGLCERQTESIDHLTN